MISLTERAKEQETIRRYYFTVHEACQMSGWSKTTIKKWLSEGKIEGAVYRGLLMVKPGEITKIKRK